MVRSQTRFTCGRPSVINDGGLVKGLRGLQHLPKPFSNNLLNSKFPFVFASASALCRKIRARSPLLSAAVPRQKTKDKVMHATFTT